MKIFKKDIYWVPIWRRKRKDEGSGVDATDGGLDDEDLNDYRNLDEPIMPEPPQ